MGQFQLGGHNDLRKAIKAARKSFEEWRVIEWPHRVKILRKAADLMTQRQFELAAILTLEVGKNRFEAIAEVSESIDLILYYCQQMEENQGYEVPLVTQGAEQTKSVLKPYGVWAVVSPFNFPLALATGMASGALVAGNTVIFKPASDTPWSGLCLCEILHQAGVPGGAFNFITGSGSEIGGELIRNPGIDGFIFTGSREVGFEIFRKFQRQFPRPCHTEMGGKNPAIVMPSADLEVAAEGIVRSAFGMGGQKCSACSRLYAHEKIYSSLMDILVEKSQALKIGDPALKETFLGPLINEAARKRFEGATRLGNREGRIVHGGKRLSKGNYSNGHFVEPTIIDQLPLSSRLFQDELFAPVLAVAKVKSIDKAIQLSNSAEYGLTAGIFTREENEKRKFFDEIQAGVAYCNRRGGATTGAWPGVQSFGGWKASGSSGKSALGPYYVAQFMREQSQTISKS